MEGGPFNLHTDCASNRGTIRRSPGRLAWYFRRIAFTGDAVEGGNDDPLGLRQRNGYRAVRCNAANHRCPGIAAQPTDDDEARALFGLDPQHVEPRANFALYGRRRGWFAGRKPGRLGDDGWFGVSLRDLVRDARGVSHEGLHAEVDDAH